MRCPQVTYSTRGRPHGIRIVSQCLSFIDESIEDSIGISKAISECSNALDISESNLWRWWRVYDKYGENHIILNARMRVLRRR